MKIIVSILFLVVCGTSLAQKWQKVPYRTFKKEYSQLLTQQPKELYSVGISTHVFEQVNASTPKTTQKSVLSVYTGSDYSFSSGGTMQLQQRELKIDIDTTEKQVVLSKGVKEDLLGYKEGQFDQIDSTKYRFFQAVEGNKIYLKVEEVSRISSMQIVSFVFDKTQKRILSLEMVYWPANYEYQSLDDQTLEQPKVRLDYSDYKTIQSVTALEQEFSHWLVKDAAGKNYSCPQTAYSFYDLLDKK